MQKLSSLKKVKKTAIKHHYRMKRAYEKFINSTFYINRGVLQGKQVWLMNTNIPSVNAKIERYFKNSKTLLGFTNGVFLDFYEKDPIVVTRKQVGNASFVNILMQVHNANELIDTPFAKVFDLVIHGDCISMQIERTYIEKSEKPTLATVVSKNNMEYRSVIQSYIDTHVLSPTIAEKENIVSVPVVPVLSKSEPEQMMCVDINEIVGKLYKSVESIDAQIEQLQAERNQIICKAESIKVEYNKMLKKVNSLL